MVRLLEDAPFGALAAMARHLEVEHASVSAWRRGVSLPEDQRWSAIETYLDLPAGYLALAADGHVDDSVHAVWPVLRRGAKPDLVVTRDDDTGIVSVVEAKMAEQFSAPFDQLWGEITKLRGEVAGLRQAVRELQEHARTDVSVSAPSTPGARASRGARRSKT